MTLEEGLPRPIEALGPLESIRWQERGMPLSAISLTASYSETPGRRPKTTSLTAWEVWVAANSNQAS